MSKFTLTQHEYCPVGDLILEGLERYLNYGIIPGSFLTAVLENNLKEAFARADMQNTENMRNIVAYMFNYVPSVAWGSREKVNAYSEYVKKSVADENATSEGAQ